MSNLPPKDEIDKALALLEQSAMTPRQIAQQRVAAYRPEFPAFPFGPQVREREPWITRTFGGKQLPVDKILSHDPLAKLVGKR
jgi:hypothetical protein